MVMYHLMFADEICVFDPTVLVDSSVFWILVATMLLNKKSLLNATKNWCSFFPKKYKQLVPSNDFLNGVRAQLFD